VATVLEGQQGVRPGLKVIVSLEQNFDLLGERLLKEVKPRHDLLATNVHVSWPYSIGLSLTSNEAV
jgi:hypothetical protein